MAPTPGGKPAEPSSDANLEELPLFICFECAELELNLKLLVTISRRAPVPLQKVLAGLLTAGITGKSFDLNQESELGIFTQTLVKQEEQRRERHEMYSRLDAEFQKMGETMHEMRGNYYKEIDHLREQLSLKGRDPDHVPDEVFFFDPSHYRIPKFHDVLQQLDALRMKRTLLDDELRNNVIQSVPLSMVCAGCRGNFCTTDINDAEMRLGRCSIWVQTDFVSSREVTDCEVQTVDVQNGDGFANCHGICDEASCLDLYRVDLHNVVQPNGEKCQTNDLTSVPNLANDNSNNALCDDRTAAGIGSPGRSAFKENDVVDMAEPANSSTMDPSVPNLANDNSNNALCDDRTAAGIGSPGRSAFKENDVADMAEPANSSTMDPSQSHYPTTTCSVLPDMSMVSNEAGLDQAAPEVSECHQTEGDHGIQGTRIGNLLAESGLTILHQAREESNQICLEADKANPMIPEIRQGQEEDNFTAVVVEKGAGVGDARADPMVAASHPNQIESHINVETIEKDVLPEDVQAPQLGLLQVAFHQERAVKLGSVLSKVWRSREPDMLEQTVKSIMFHKLRSRVRANSYLAGAQTESAVVMSTIPINEFINSQSEELAVTPPIKSSTAGSKRHSGRRYSYLDREGRPTSSSPARVDLNFEVRGNKWDVGDELTQPVAPARDRCLNAPREPGSRRNSSPMPRHLSLSPARSPTGKPSKGGEKLVLPPISAPRAPQ